MASAPFASACASEFFTALQPPLAIGSYDKESLLEDCTLILDAVSDCTEIDEKLKSLYEETDVVVELTKRCVEENSQAALNQDEYLQRYNSLVERYEGLKKKIATLDAQKQDKQFKGT